MHNHQLIRTAWMTRPPASPAHHHAPPGCSRTHKPTPARRWEAEDRLRRAAPAGAAGRHHSLTRRRLALGDPWGVSSAAWACAHFRFEMRTAVCVTSLRVEMVTFAAARCAPRRVSGGPRYGRIWACCGRVLARCGLCACCFCCLSVPSAYTLTSSSQGWPRAALELGNSFV